MVHWIGKNLYFSFFKLETSYYLLSKKLKDFFKSHGIVQNNKKTALAKMGCFQFNFNPIAKNSKV